MTRPADALPPSLDDFDAIARAAWANLPGHFRRLAGDVVVRVEEYPPDDVLEEMEIDDPLELTGLYTGVDLTRQSVTAPAPVIPMVFLFRMPILFEWSDRGDVPLGELIAHVLVHEVGHHFGLSDEDMDALLDQA